VARQRQRKHDQDNVDDGNNSNDDKEGRNCRDGNCNKRRVAFPLVIVLLPRQNKRDMNSCHHACCRDDVDGGNNSNDDK